MLIEIDFNSDEAIYIQLRNQIIMGIATSTIHEGDTLPSVRQLADNIGINMHTVNKAYTTVCMLIPMDSASCRTLGRDSPSLSLFVAIPTMI